ncbi:MAG: DoxX family protein [Sphingobacteriales bacterium]
MNGSFQGTNRLVFPSLAGFYVTSNEIGYALLRIVTGAILFVHGWGKVHTGITGVSASMAKMGLVPGFFFGGAAIFLETLGAFCLVLGLFTRFFAAALVVEMAIALLFVHLVKGFSVSQGGFEYVLLLGVVLFAIALRGGGPYSIDRMLGKEL